MSRQTSTGPAPESQIVTLTALRFFAAAWVVLYHYWPNLDPVRPAIAAKGYLGVELFFVLSGFVISYVYQPQIERGVFAYGRFLWARVARIYPLHLATLAAVAAMGIAATVIGVQVAAEMLDVRSLPANLLMIHAWGFAPTAAFNHPSWSISAEWFAYLTFPAFAAVAMRLSGRPLLAVGGAVALVFALYAGFEQAAGFPLTEATIAWGALRIVPCFALGCAVHLLWRSLPPVSRTVGWATVLFFAAVTLGLVAAGGPDAALTSSFGGLICGLAIIWRARAPQDYDGPVTRVFAYLGEISYSTYMICIPWQLVFVNVANRLTGSETDQMPLALWLVFIVSLIPLSAISHHLIERPARGWLKAHAPGRGRGATLQPAE